ncbi:hypothetical protein PG995_011154 [Apiospora arundinis]|uniref:Uncharacterized protein n=1 Tax=Apiospora arundinis TaxID=335852 RepID=A0ABR2IVJ1_9PEZI
MTRTASVQLAFFACLSAIRHIREGPELLRIRGHGGVDTLPVRHGVVGVEEVGLPDAGTGAVFGDEVLALDVAGLEVAAVEADGGHALLPLHAAPALEVGDFDGHRPTVGVRVSPQPEVGHGQNRLGESRYGYHFRGRLVDVGSRTRGKEKGKGSERCERANIIMLYLSARRGARARSESEFCEEDLSVGMSGEIL